jgi:hypothetical protein
LAELEEAIQAKERELAELESRMGEAGFFDDPVRGAAAGERHGTLAREIEALYGEWDSLEA